MIVTAPETVRTVEDYDIVFQSGMMMPVTIAKHLGDTIEFGDATITVKLTAKPSQSDPLTLLPAEDTIIFLKHVISVQHRTREVVELTPDQKVEWAKTWQELKPHPTIQ